jgi:hypothetical protein
MRTDHDRTARRLLPAPVRAATSGVFRALSSARDARVFHPRGVTFRGRLSVTTGVAGSDLLRPGRHDDAYVRLSRGFGLPEPLPDILGLAVKIPDAYGPGADQDLLLASSPDVGLLHRLLVPTVGFGNLPYSSATTYVVGGRRLLFGAVIETPDPGRGPTRLEDAVRRVAAGDLTVHLTIATDGSAWEPVAEIELGDVLPLAKGEHLRFDPWNTGGGIAPVGVLNRLRAAAYPGSQEGRAA